MGLHVLNEVSFCQPCLQVQEDVYEKIDKDLLQHVEDVLLNRCVFCMKNDSPFMIPVLTAERERLHLAS